MSARSAPIVSRPEVLRMAAQLNPAVSEPSVVMVCGLADDRGIAALAVEFGRCFALMRGGPVLAADFGFIAPPRAAFSIAAGKPGMREVLSGNAVPGDIEAPDATPGLNLIGAGGLQNFANPLLGPDLAALTGALRQRYRVSFLAVDPLLAGPTALRLARAVDGVVLGVAAGFDRSDDLATSADLFDQMGAKVLGCVLIEDR